MSAHEYFSTGETLILKKIDLLKRYFKLPQHKLAAAINVGKPGPVTTDNLDESLRAHITGQITRLSLVGSQQGGQAVGRVRLGAYFHTATDLVSHACVDVDGPGHAMSLADPDLAVRRILHAANQIVLPMYLERSGGGAGWHLWIFFAQPVLAWKVRRLLLSLIPEDLLLSDGRRCDPKNNRGVEVFPKQDTVSKTGYGNMVYFPFWADANNGGGDFYEPTEGGLKKIEVEDLKILYASEELLPKFKESRHQESNDHGSGPGWRAEMLRKLDLNAVYGEYLTGAVSSVGWLECRDPDSPSGDSDPSAGVADGGNAFERGSFHSFISGKTIDLFNFLVLSRKCKDYADAVHWVTAQTGVKTETGIKTKFITNVQLSELLKVTRECLDAQNVPPKLFRSGDLFCEVRRHADGSLYKATIDQTRTLEILADSADWVRVGKDGHYAAVEPPKNLVRIVANSPSQMLPELNDVGRCPLLAGDGTLLSTSGYHASVSSYLDLCSSLEGLDVSAAPSDAEVESARLLLIEDMLGDFPFETESDRTHYVAILLQGIMKEYVRSRPPLPTIEATTPGSGKGLLTAGISIIHTGQLPRLKTLPTDESEVRKNITSALLGGERIIVYDNVATGVVNSASLAAAATADIWSDRVLGQSKVVHIPNTALFVINGNNFTYSSEISRRALPVRLNAKIEKPWMRRSEEFRHADLVGWIKSERTRLLKALIMLVRRWLSVGTPKAKVSLGTFQDWAATMGGILQCTGFHGFMEKLDSFYESSDVESADWLDFVEAWWEVFKGKEVRASDLVQNQLVYEPLRPLIDIGRGNQADVTKTGLLLRAGRDRILGNYRVTSLPKKKNKASRYYQLHLVDPALKPVEVGDDAQF